MDHIFYACDEDCLEKMITLGQELQEDLKLYHSNAENFSLIIPQVSCFLHLAGSAYCVRRCLILSVLVYQIFMFTLKCLL